MIPPPVHPIAIHCSPPSHGWLSLRITAGTQSVDIDASDVPNNPIQGLVDALDRASLGIESEVWWNEEPDGYFMRFNPAGGLITLTLEFAPDSQRGRAQTVLQADGSAQQVLMPFWRFLRDFQSRSHTEPHWPSVDYGRIAAIKESIARHGPA